MDEYNIAFSQTFCVFMYIEFAETLGSTLTRLSIGSSDGDLAPSFSFRHETHSFLQRE